MPNAQPAQKSEQIRRSFGMSRAHYQRLRLYCQTKGIDKSEWLSEQIERLPRLRIVEDDASDAEDTITHDDQTRKVSTPTTRAKAAPNPPAAQQDHIAASVAKANAVPQPKEYDGFSAAYWAQQKESTWPESYRRSLK